MLDTMTDIDILIGQIRDVIKLNQMEQLFLTINIVIDLKIYVLWLVSKLVLHTNVSQLNPHSSTKSNVRDCLLCHPVQP